MNPAWGHLVGVVIVIMMMTFIGIWAWAWLPYLYGDRKSVV